MRPRIVVFYGGMNDNSDLSNQTGQWICQYVPRDKYDITPVEITPDGLWKVPLGNLPKTGSVDRTIYMLSEAVRPLDPKQALQRLLDRPVHSAMTVVRGIGGDDGSLHSLGKTLGIPVVGSNESVCQNTFDKYNFSRMISHIAPTPHTQRFRPDTSLEDIIAIARERFMPPLFVKPSNHEGSSGIEYVEHLDELASAIQSARKGNADILLQERIPGTELAVTVERDNRGNHRVLPATAVHVKKSPFYDHASKRNPGRIDLRTLLQDDAIISEAQRIACDIYDELGCKGLATIDMIENKGSMHVLELNTIPTYSELTPLRHQLKAAGLHPTELLDRIINESLQEG